MRRRGLLLGAALQDCRGGRPVAGDRSRDGLQSVWLGEEVLPDAAEIRVAEVRVAVAEDALLDLGEPVRAAGAGRGEAIEPDLGGEQGHLGEDRPGGGGGCGQDLGAAKAESERRAELRGVEGEVSARQDPARPALACGELARDAPAVEAVGAMIADRCQRGSERWLPEQDPDSRRLAGGQEDRRRLGV
jgi:hypothetical protein